MRSATSDLKVENTDEDQETWGFDHAMFGESKTIEMASGFDYPGFD